MVVLYSIGRFTSAILHGSALCKNCLDSVLRWRPGVRPLCRGGAAPDTFVSGRIVVRGQQCARPAKRVAAVDGHRVSEHVVVAEGAGYLRLRHLQETVSSERGVFI